MPGSAATHWAALAAAWAKQGPPLRPGPEDVERYRQAVSMHRPGDAGRRSVLLLGVTREIATLAWPYPVELTAADNSLSMIRALWKHDSGHRRVACADWRALPLREGSLDVAAGDGCLSVIAFPQAARTMSRELRRVLRPDGLLALRLFCRPEADESVGSVHEALAAGAIDNPHCLRWRIAMAVQGGDTGRGVSRDVIWRAYQPMAGDARRMADRFAWAPEALELFENYRGGALRLHFPTLAESVAAMAEFRLGGVSQGRYAMGERFPILSLRPA